MKKHVVLLFIGLIFTGCKMAPDSSEVMIDNSKIIQTPAGIYFSGYWPDGKLNLVKKGSQWQLFWAEADSVLTENVSVWPENHYASVLAKNIVFGESKKEGHVTGLNENGSWFIGVHPLDEDGNYVGFFHGESHWVARENKKTESDWMAHKSIGVAYSHDYGKTWQDVAPIIVDAEKKPEKPEWSGLGDGCVVWDEKNSRWLCYYQAPVYGGLFDLIKMNKLCMAASYDPEGKPGTWKKWDGNTFSLDAYNSSTGTGGKNVAIDNLEEVPGANPSVMWNSYLNRWIMVYASWGHEIYISFSDDGEAWSSPERILGSDKNPVWYPNLISEEGDKTGGKNVRMYYSYGQGSDPNESGKRKLAYCELIF